MSAPWDRPRVDLEGLVEAWAPRASLLEAVSPLPRGLIHADAIELVEATPAGFLPLTEGSPWSASGRLLAVEVGVDPVGVLQQIAAYAAWSDRLRQLPPRLGDALRASGLGPQIRRELLERLGLSELDWLELERGGVTRDLGWMVERPFRPVLRVASELRPSWRRAAGHRLGERLLERLPVGAAPLLASTSPLALELISPYTKDLGHALHAWAIENAHRLEGAHLAEAARAAGRAPSEELAALAAAELLALEGAPILEERRQAEASQGLELHDGPGLTAGWAQLERLAEPDRVLRGTAGALLVAVGPDPLALEALIQTWLDAGRVLAVGLVGQLRGEDGEPVIPDALVTDRDGYALPGAAELRSAADGLGQTVRNADLLELDEEGPAGWTARILGRMRRDLVTGRTPLDGRVWAIYHAEGSGLAARTAALRACRNVLQALGASLTVEPSPAESLPSVSSPNRRSARRFRV